MNGTAITFDFHNTLAACPKWFELEVRTLPAAFLQWWSASQGQDFRPESVAEAAGRYRELRRQIIAHGNELTAEASLEQIFTEMTLDVPENAIQTGVETLMREAFKGVSPIPGAVETIRELHQAGIPLGVVSSAVYHPFLEWTLQDFGVLDLMETVITSASAGFYKSRPEIYLRAATELRANPAQIVHVGDSLRFDVGGAGKVGMGTVWLQHEQELDRDSAYVPDLTIQSLRGSTAAILTLLDARTAASGARVANGS